jgi:signal transduction histidine kinase
MGGPDALVRRISRLVAEAADVDAVLSLLADAAVENLGADAALVARVLEDGRASVAATRNLPEQARSWSIDADSLGAELVEDVLARCAGAFTRGDVRLLISDRGLFGALVLLGSASSPDEPGRLGLADALVDIAATALSRAAQLEKLRVAHEELHAAQEALVRSEKLRALGEMAAGVSHDLKNILNPLWLHLQIIERAVGKKRLEDVADSAAEMRQVLKRGLQTIERLREYSRQAPESPAEKVDLDAAVGEALEIGKARLASRASRSTVRISKELGGAAPVFGRTGDIVSALVNLVVNAIDALQDGGTITVSTGSDAKASWVRVADDGPGMPPEIEERIFQPFFTTKGDEGTGLGLAMVIACMQRQKGSVRLQTAPGKGAAFTLTFPRTEEA